jgi:hypothetical protein
MRLLAKLAHESSALFFDPAFTAKSTEMTMAHVSV